MDVFDALRRERLRLADELEGLTPEQWEVQSLCAQWRVRDVLAHLVASTDMRLAVMFGRLLRNGFNVDRTLSQQAREMGQRPPQELLPELRERAASRHTPPGAKPINLMSDCVMHSQDIRRPLGLPCTIDPATLRAAADFLATNDFNCRSAKRAAGLRLVATDVDWSHGDGPEVRGPLEALVMSIAGRVAACSDLDGPGVDELRSRCPTNAVQAEAPTPR